MALFVNKSAASLVTTRKCSGYGHVTQVNFNEILVMLMLDDTSNSTFRSCTVGF